MAPRVGRPLLAMTLAALALAGCGGGGSAGGSTEREPVDQRPNPHIVHGVDTSDPGAVVTAYVEARWGCNERGSLLIWDLTLPTQRPPRRSDWSDQPGDCVDRRPPPFEVIRQQAFGNRIYYRVDFPGGDVGDWTVAVAKPEGSGWRIDHDAVDDE